MQIHANNLALSAGRGPVYGPLTCGLDSGLTVLRGDPGSGRTSLLLTFSGRMKHDAGTLTVGGYALPRNLRPVQKLSAIAGFSGIDDLEDSVTVGAALRERRAWLSPWWARVRRLNDVDVAEVCAPVFGELPIPHANTVIWDLDELTQFLLRITLAMMASPQMLFIDDVEQVRSTDSRAAVWARLATIAADERTVVVSASSLDTALWRDLGIDPHVIDLAEHSAPTSDETTTDENTAAENPGEEPTTPLHELRHELIEETV